MPTPMTGQPGADGAPKRMTQQQRRDATQRVVLEATLRCLGEYGYAATTIEKIVTEAGVSRGAILHHYPNKVLLVAAAIDHFYVQRMKRFKDRMEEAGGAAIPLKDKLLIFRANFEEWMPIGLEHVVAMRTNPELAEAYERLQADNPRTEDEMYTPYFPELPGADSPADLITIMACFLRGLGIESIDTPKERIDKLFDEFVTILLEYQSTARTVDP